MDEAAVDCMIIDYLEQAMEIGYNPSTDPDRNLAPEREAVFRLFLWSKMIVLATVLRQLAGIKDAAWRDRLNKLVLIHMPENQILAGEVQTIESRTKELLIFHGDTFDCRIVAEAESIEASALLSFDHKLRKRLSSHTTLPLLAPSEYWERLAILRGTPPTWTPAPSNPMSHETWWHW